MPSPDCPAAAATAADAEDHCEALLTEAPHLGREAEYETVVAYVARRWAHDTNTALFVCGGCGCGKTSTVKRALRAMSSRVLPCDATGRSLVKRSSIDERGWSTAAAAVRDADSAMSTPRHSHQHTPASAAAALVMSPEVSGGFASAHTSSPSSGRPSTASDDSTASALAAAGPTRTAMKRPREEAEDDCADADAGEGAQQHTKAAKQRAHCSGGSASVPYSLDYFQSRYPEVFGKSSSTGTRRNAAATATASASSSSRSLFGHYVNCADVSGPQLVEAICESIKATCTRGDSATQSLLEQLSRIGSKASNGGASATTGRSPASSASSARQTTRTALHVVALDEVEYVRGGGARTLAQLADVAFQLPAQLALIFISNQRAFVHVPQMMLEALLFEPYSEAQLRRIGADTAAAELRRCERLASASGGRSSSSPSVRNRPASSPAPRKAAARTARPALCASDVDIKPRLYDYIARKALLEFSGDVRQVIAMCHRVVTVAWEEVTEARCKAAAAAAATTVSPVSKSRKSTSSNNSNGGASVLPLKVSADLPSKLEAVVETFSAGSTSTRSSTEQGAAGSSSSGRSSSSTDGAATPAAPATGVMTLARSVRLLQSNQVESEIDRHVGTLPEQTLYVLSCIVVLTLRRQETRTQASTSVGGRMGTSRTPNAGMAAAHRSLPTLSLKMQEVHQLYTRLMAELHFPAMRADGFPLQVECLADFGVLTRPQLRGTDRVFSLNGAWTLQAMQQALVKRGEALRQDRIAAGAEVVMENKFEEVLRELTRLVKY